VADESAAVAQGLRTAPARLSPRGNGLLIALVVLGLGLIAAPALFQMFERAPAGSQMINEFRPFMTKAEVVKLRGFLREIDTAVIEANNQIDPAAASALGVDRAAYEEQFAYLTEFEAKYPAINADMSEMLDNMERNLDNFAGIDALPPFSMFPWFFVIPGLLIAGVAGGALIARRRGKSIRGPLVVLVVLGVGLIAAPVVFQMFARAWWRRHDRRLQLADDPRKGHDDPGLLRDDRRRRR